MRSLARASQARSDMREGKRIGFSDYSQLDASADKIDNFISELNKLEIQLATAVGVQDNYKKSLGGILGLVKSIGGKEDSPMGKFQTDVEALDKQFKDGDLTYQQYSDELKGLALTFLSQNDVISSSERDLMNEIISNNQANNSFGRRMLLIKRWHLLWLPQERKSDLLNKLPIWKKRLMLI